MVHGMECRRTSENSTIYQINKHVYTRTRVKRTKSHTSSAVCDKFRVTRVKTEAVPKPTNTPYVDGVLGTVIFRSVFCA